MNDSVYKLSMDIHEHASQAVLKAKKTDTGRKLHITLRAGGTPYTIADDCYAAFKATKPDGTVLFNACTIENNEIIYEFTEQTCTSVGRCKCEIALYGPDDKIITSPRFSLLVDGTIYPDEILESKDEFSALTYLISGTLEATNAAIEAAGSAVEAAGSARVSAYEAELSSNSANQAAEAATQSANLASDASGIANTAAVNANEAAISANSAANNANIAASNANKATDDLNDKFDELASQIEIKGNGSIVLTPEYQITADLLQSNYDPFFYTALSVAVSDLNAGTIGTNADATADNAVCAVYTDYEGNTCLTLLSDINLGEIITISATCIFKVNGYTINYTGDYGIYFECSNCVFDLRVPDSQLIKHTASATNVALVKFIGSGNLLIGGSISYIADSASKAVAVISIESSDTVIKDCSIYEEVKSGNNAVYCASINGSVTLQNAKITVKSGAGIGYGIRATNESTGFTLSECSIAVRCDVSKSYGIVSSAEVEHIVENCTILSGSPGEDAYGIYVDATARFCISNCNIFADGIHGGEGITQEESDLPGKSVAIFTKGTATVENCNVFGTLCGINCGTGSTTTINGGLYEGVGHGGIYFANIDGNCYVQNATFKCVPYKGSYKDKYMYQGADYLNAAAYLTNKPGVKAYADNCVFDGGGPCLRVDEGTAEEPAGGEPIRFKKGGTGNALYASNCTFMGDGKIRFGGGGDQHLYLGFANRVLCEANLPDCVDSTTYKNKVFTSYEEV